MIFEYVYKLYESLLQHHDVNWMHVVAVLQVADTGVVVHFEHDCKSSLASLWTHLRDEKLRVVHGQVVLDPDERVEVVQRESTQFVPITLPP